MQRSPGRRPPISGRLPHRSPLGWGLALLLSAASWGALCFGLLSVRTGVGGVGLMFAGGWTLSLLPVHSARFRGVRPRGPRPPGSHRLPAGITGEDVVRVVSDGIRRLRKAS
jgi:hypothetical protein